MSQYAIEPTATLTLNTVADATLPVWDHVQDFHSVASLMMCLPSVNRVHCHRIKTTMSLLREKMPETHLLMLGILPRGDGRNSSSTYVWPGIYTPAIHYVNSWLEEEAKEKDIISYLDCGPMLLVNGQVSWCNKMNCSYPRSSVMLESGICFGI